MATTGVSGIGVGIVAAGGLLMYAGIRDVPVLDALRQITSGKLPEGNKSRDGQAGAATTAAYADLNTTTDATGAAAAPGAVSASSVSGGALPQLAQAALQYQGVPYRFGGTDPATGLDCSGLVQRSFADIGITSPRTTYTQQAWGALHTIPEGSMSAGDLVFWPGHVAVSVGGGMVVHAPHAGDVVRVVPVTQAGPVGTSATVKRYGGAKPKAKSAAV